MSGALECSSCGLRSELDLAAEVIEAANASAAVGE